MANEKDKDQLKAEKLSRQIEESRKKLQEDLNLTREEDLENEENVDELDTSDNLGEDKEDELEKKHKASDDIEEDERLERELEDQLGEDDLEEDEPYKEESLDDLEEEELLNDEIQRQKHQEIIDAKQETRLSFDEYHKKNESFLKEWEKRNQEDEYSKSAKRSFGKSSSNNLQDKKENDEVLKKDSSTLKQKTSQNFIEIDGVKVKVEDVFDKNQQNYFSKSSYINKDILNRYYSGDYKKAFKNNKEKSVDPTSNTRGFSKVKKENLLDNKYDFSKRSIKDLLSKNTKIPDNDLKEKAKFTEEQIRAIQKVNKTILLNKALLKKIDLDEVSNIITSFKGVDNDKLDKILGLDKNKESEEKSLDKKDKKDKKISKNIRDKKADQKSKDEIKSRANLNNREKSIADIKNLTKPTTATLNAQELSSATNLIYRRNKLNEEKEYRALENRQLNNRRIKESIDRQNLQKNRGLSETKKVEEDYVAKNLSYEKYLLENSKDSINQRTSLNRRSLRLQQSVDRKFIKNSTYFAKASIIGGLSVSEKRLRDGYNRKNLKKLKSTPSIQRRINLSNREIVSNRQRDVFDKYRKSSLNRRAIDRHISQRRIASQKAQRFVINNRNIKDAYIKQAKTLGIVGSRKLQDDKFKPQSLGHEKYGKVRLTNKNKTKNDIDDNFNEKAQRALNRKTYQKRAFDTRKKINTRIARGKIGNKTMLKTPGFSTASQNSIAGISSLATISARRNLLKRRYEVSALRREEALLKSGRLKEAFRKKNDLLNNRYLNPSKFKGDFNEFSRVSISHREEERRRFKERDRQRLKTSKDKGFSSNVRGKKEEELLSKTRLDKEISEKLKTDKLLSDKVKGSKDLTSSVVDSASEYNSNKDNQTEEGKNAQKAEKRLRNEILKRNKGSFSGLADSMGSASSVTGQGIVSANRASNELLSKATKDKNIKMNNLDVVKGRNGKQTLARNKDILESRNVESGILSKERRDARFLQENRFDKIKSNMELEKGIKEKKTATQLYQDSKKAKGKSLDVGGSKDDDLLINKIKSPYNRDPKDTITKTKPTLSDKILSRSNRVSNSSKISMGSSKVKNDRASNTFSNFSDKAKMDRRMIDRFQEKNALGRFMNPGMSTGSLTPNPFAAMKKVAGKSSIATSFIAKGMSSLMISGLALGGAASGTMGPTNARGKDIDDHFDTISAKFYVDENKSMSFTQDAIYMAQARMGVYYKQIAHEEPTAQELGNAGEDLRELKEIEVRKATLDGEPIDPKSFDLYNLKDAKLFGGTVVSLNVKYSYVKEDWETLIGKDNFILDEYSDIQFPDGSSGAMAPPTVISGGGGYFVGGALRGAGNEKDIWNFFKDQGFSDAGIAGIMGNLAHESGLEPGRHQDGGGPGHGLAQWEGPRWTNLQNFARQRGTAWDDLGTQLQFMMSELRDYPALIQVLRSATNPQDAAETFEKIYERAGIKSYAERKGYAQQFYDKRDSLTVPMGGNAPSTNDDTPQGIIGLDLFRKFIMPTAYADDEDGVVDNPDTETTPGEGTDDTQAAEDSANNTMPSTVGLGIMSSEESIGQIVFLRDLLSLSALGAMYKDPKDMTDYKIYCLDIIDYAVTGEGAKGKTPTATVDFVSYIVEDEEGNKTKLITASVKLAVMCDLKTLEDNDKNFHEDWDLKFGGSGWVKRKVNNGDKYGDRMPQRYMALPIRDFNEIFKVNIQPASFASGLMNAGGFLFNVADFEGVTGIPYVDWAISIANNPAHGYSQYNRDGNPDYDCSSLVFYALKGAGFPVGNSAFATFSMLGDLQAVGFTAIPFSFNALQPGDVVLNPGSHTEIYIGGGMTVGAKSSHEGDGIHGTPGDQSGDEIKVDQMRSSYERILRPPSDYMQKVNTEREKAKKDEEAKKKAEEDKKKQEAIKNTP